MKTRLANIRSFFRNLVESRLKMFRLFAAVLALDIIAVFSLASFNPLHFWNPLQFLKETPTDNRKKLTLFYPLTFPEVREKEKDNLPIRGIEQKVDWQEGDSQQALLNNANAILTEIANGPIDLTVKRFLDSREIFRRVWVVDSNSLVIDIRESQFQTMSKDEKEIFKACVQKSISRNLPQFKKILFSVSG